jgi:colanic acid biosynthesis glycosyl transferase WcaI
MRILLISCVFPPEPVTSASTSHSLARGLAKRNHDVSVITSYPSRPEGKLFPGFRRHLLKHDERRDNIDVVRCFSTVSPRSSTFSRFAENLSFGLCAGLAMASAPRPDVIYANTWPIFAAGIVSWLAKLRKIPVVLSIQDVYPESLISLKKLSPRTRVARLLRWLDATIARFASAIVVISERSEEIYWLDRGIAREKIHRIANWRPSEDQPTAERAQQQRRLWGMATDVFLIVFAGNIAAACGIESVITVVSGLDASLLVQLVIAGSGSALESCRSIADQCEGKGITFTGPFATRETLSILNAAEILILPTLGDQSLVCMPSKMISYMMSGRPVLAIAHPESDLAKLVNASGCGWVAEPGAHEALANQIIAVAALDRLELTRIGSLGRQYALTHFSAEVCLPRLIAVVESAAAKLT